MEGKEAFSRNPSDSWEYESSDEDVQQEQADPRTSTGEPYTALPPRSSSATSFSEKAAVHLYELFDLSEEEGGFSDEEKVNATAVTLQNTASTELHDMRNERRAEGVNRMQDEEEETVTLLLGEGRSTAKQESGEVGACFPCRRCPCAKGLEKEERVMRWLLLCGFFFCVPWAVATYMGLCTSRKNKKGLRQIGRLAALLWALAWLLLITICVVVTIILIRGDKELLIPLHWDTPYNMRQTTRCGTRGASIKVEHEAMTHLLSEKTYGTVAFVGLMPAKTWSDADLLTHVYKLGFDAVAISPPGIGSTTNVTSLKDSFYNDENFLNQVLESCLDIRLNSTVVVSHSNIITRQYFFPLLMNTALLGFVLFDSYAGEEWITEVNPALNDHLFYNPKTRNYRYVGNRRLSEKLLGIQASHLERGNPSSAGEAGIPLDLASSPINPQAATLLSTSPKDADKQPARLLQAVNCVAAEFDADTDDAWDNIEPHSLGPYQFFPGKYKVPGWGLRQAALLATPLDAPPDAKSSLLDVLSSTGAGILSGFNRSEDQVDRVVEEARIVPTRETPAEYFDPLKAALTDFLTEIKDKIDLGNYYPERLPVAFRDDRKEAYTTARVKTTLIDPSTIYCLQGSTKNDVRSVSGQLEPIPGEELSQRAAVSSQVVSPEQSESPRTHGSSLRLRGGADHEVTNFATVANPSLTAFYGKSVPAYNEDPTGQQEYLGEVTAPVDPGRFSSSEKHKLLELYAIRDRLRAQDTARKHLKEDNRLYTAARMH